MGIDGGVDRRKRAGERFVIAADLLICVCALRPMAIPVPLNIASGDPVAADLRDVAAGPDVVAPRPDHGNVRDLVLAADSDNDPICCWTRSAADPRQVIGITMVCASRTQLVRCGGASDDADPS